MTFPTITWAVKLFVAATPTSGPQFRVSTSSDSLASDDPAAFTTEITFAPFPLATLTACRRSAVSPLWLNATTTVPLSRKWAVSSNSPARTASHLTIPSRFSLSLRSIAAW